MSSLTGMGCGVLYEPKQKGNQLEYVGTGKGMKTQTS